MVIKFSRAQRRHDRMRMYNHVKQLNKYAWWDDGRETEEELKKWYGLFRDNASKCSCQMCCNIRNSLFADHPLTMQERRAEYKYKDGLEELKGE